MSWLACAAAYSFQKLKGKSRSLLIVSLNSIQTVVATDQCIIECTPLSHNWTHPAFLSSMTSESLPELEMLI